MPSYEFDRRRGTGASPVHLITRTHARARRPCHRMAGPFYILCPGQGAKAVGMGKDFYEASPAARKVFDVANEIVGFDLKSICFSGPDERLNQTDVSQPAIFATSVASFRAA